MATSSSASVSAGFAVSGRVDRRGSGAAGGCGGAVHGAEEAGGGRLFNPVGGGARTPEAGADLPDLGRPRFEIRIVGHAPLERDGFELGLPRRLPRAGRVAAVTVLDDVGRALEGADLADARHVPAVPLHAELEVLVWIETLRVDREGRHETSC